MCRASGTWTRKKEHERIDNRRKAKCSIIQTKRRYKKIVKQKDKTNEEDTNDMSGTGHESADGQRSNTHKDQDSDVSFENDTEEEADTTEIE